MFSDLDGDCWAEMTFYDFGSSQTKLWIFDSLEGMPGLRTL